MDLVGATAGVRSSTDFDHFREDAGQPHISTMFDDGDLDRMPPRKIKAFFDKKKKSQMTTERYSSTKFDGKEHRSAGDNKVDLAAEPHITLDGQRSELPFRKSSFSAPSHWSLVERACDRRWDVNPSFRRARSCGQRRSQDSQTRLWGEPFSREICFPRGIRSRRASGTLALATRFSAR
eukprot:840795-Pyramimonas_sp.AAC.1